MGVPGQEEEACACSVSKRGGQEPTSPLYQLELARLSFASPR